VDVCEHLEVSESVPALGRFWYRDGGLGACCFLGGDFESKS
jgi:hypothetical protein